MDSLVLQETAIRMLQDNIQHYCRLFKPVYSKMWQEVNNTHCAHGVALVSTL
jgi:hypothetical protein